jgi:phosphoribosyl 1,2-cyclic phosphate phosphodiesterase
MLRAKCKRLDAVVFTHGHKDHTAGFDDIRAYNYIQKKALDVYLDERVEEVLRRDFYYCFLDFKYPGIPQFEMHRIEEEPFHVGPLQVIPITLMHYKLPVLGFRIGDFCYITDANYIADQEKLKIKGCKVLVVNALKREKHISHFTLEEAVALAQEIGAERTFFTHMSHQMGKQEDVNAELPAGIQLAFDGLELDL